MSKDKKARVDPSSLDSRGEIQKTSGAAALKMIRRAPRRKDSDPEKEALKKKVAELEARVAELEAELAARPVVSGGKPADINFDAMVNQKAQATKKVDKLAFLKKLVDENLELRKD